LPTDEAAELRLRPTVGQGFLAAALAVIFIALSWWALTWLALLPVGSTLGLSGGWGLILSVWGLLLSIGGFTVTWWQLSRTRTSAAAAARAISRLKRDFGSFDVVTEARTARLYAEAAQSHSAGQRWAEALYSYNSIRTSLTKMVSVSDALSSEQYEIARDYIATFLDACQSIENLKDVDPDKLSAELLNYKLRELDGFLINVEYSLKDAIRG